MSRIPQWRQWATSAASAAFEALGLWENIDSPKKHAPSAMP